MRRVFGWRHGRQLKLFPSYPKTPAWSGLPEATRRKAEVMLARMLREHRLRCLETQIKGEASNE